MRAAVASVLVLVVVVVGLDLALTRAAERQASEQAQILLSAPATVDLRGWPVSVRLLTGSIPAVDVHATDVPTDSGVRLDRVDATLRRVRLRLGDLAEGGLPADAESGTFVALLDSEGVQQILGDLGRSGVVQLVAGRIRFEISGFTIASGVSVDQGVLVLTPLEGPPGLPDRFEVPLPELPAGIDVERVAVVDGALRLEGSFAPESLAPLAGG